ncbi:sodium:calcium antiporter [Halocalculus aciditolerans]|uniref:Membrane protein n=1 Tax=Halocalculus aciditolerans TaxID=1383812 RepID=A0A830F4N6_9EURY|nr:sodium:calcium antiporter [Halocalculus aciditolerans]GGL63283.1 membrane protein [Halocalculus aciditolerans]
MTAFASATPLVLTGSVRRVAFLVLAFACLLAGAEVFTNGVEWFGHRLGISQSATGSILAAMGTALPETTIPVIAIIEGGTAAEHVGVGAILGAPFMLATLAMFFVGASVLWFADRRVAGTALRFDRHATNRDLSFFLVGYTLAFLAALVPHGLALGPVPVRDAIAGLLVALYLAYLALSLRAGELGDVEDIDDLHIGLFLERLLAALGVEPDRDHSADPHLVLTAVQTLVALALIIAGARLFVTEIEWASTAVGVPTAIVALIVAPVATELPEAFNSVLWLARDKDTLALNNITGAMAFQGTIPVTLGILFTQWDLSLAWGTTGFLNAFSVILAVIAGLVVFSRARLVGDGEFEPAPFLVGGVFYLAFLALTVYFVLHGAHLRA